MRNENRSGHAVAQCELKRRFDLEPCVRLISGSSGWNVMDPSQPSPINVFTFASTFSARGLMRCAPSDSTESM